MSLLTFCALLPTPQWVRQNVKDYIKILKLLSSQLQKYSVLLNNFHVRWWPKKKIDLMTAVVKIYKGDVKTDMCLVNIVKDENIC